MEFLFRLLGVAAGATILFVFFGDIVNPALSDLWEHTLRIVDDHVT